MVNIRKYDKVQKCKKSQIKLMGDFGFKWVTSVTTNEDP